MKFKITIDGKEYHANMVDNKLNKQIADMCPFEANYKRYKEHEYYTELPKNANQEGCKLTTEAKSNKIYYFSGWNAFTILFGDCNTSPFEVVELGEIIEDVKPQLRNSFDTVLVKCELEEEN